MSALTIGCALIAAACSEPSTGQSRRGGGSTVAVQTTATKRITIQRQVDLAGTLLSPNQAKVSAEAAGVVRSVLVEIGREVRVGDPLVTLEPRQLSLELARAESALRQTRAQLGMADPLADADAPPPDDQIGSVRNALANRDEARANADRAKTLSARGLISPADLQTAETRLKVAEAGYQSAVDT
ncbi:MAG: biotin/lipoyl-binding protein, partial [Acidobacteriota bacterium]